MDVRKVFKYPPVYMENKEKTARVLLPESPSQIANINPQKVKEEILSYKWREGDFLLASYPKTGTHLCWEIMSMLLKGSEELLEESKMSYMIDIFMNEASQMPSPKVLNTHLRLDVLPDEFQNRKTVYITRNPRDTCVSAYHHFMAMLNMIPNLPGPPIQLENYAEMFLTEDVDSSMYGTFFDYTDFMWNHSKKSENILVIFYEDLIFNRLPVVKKINEFMETGRSEEFMRTVVEQTRLKNMKGVKNEMPPIKPPTMMIGHPTLSDEPMPFTERKEASLTAHIGEHTGKHAPKTPRPMAKGFSIFRKGIVGDWKNCFTTEMNKKFDKILTDWKTGEEINYTYE